jgi:hypothetical protein
VVNFGFNSQNLWQMSRRLFELSALGIGIFIWELKICSHSVLLQITTTTQSVVASIYKTAVSYALHGPGRRASSQYGGTPIYCGVELGKIWPLNKSLMRAGKTQARLIYINHKKRKNRQKSNGCWIPMLLLNIDAVRSLMETFTGTWSSEQHREVNPGISRKTR